MAHRRPFSPMRAVLLIAAFFAISQSETVASTAGKLRIKVVGLASPEGAVMVALYDSEEAFSQRSAPFMSGRLAIENLVSEWVVEGIPEGDYAIRVYHDVNGNREMDRSAIGIPKEPVGFSNNARARFGPPSYEDARFMVGDRPETVEIRLVSALGGSNGGIGLGVGIGVISSASEYRGEGRSLMPIPFITYFGDRFYVVGPRLGMKLGGWGNATLRLITGFRFGGYDGGDSDFLSGMDGRRHTLDAGLNLSYALPSGFGLDAEFLTDALGRHRGREAKVSLKKSFRAGGWSFAPSAGLTRQSARLADYYYGVRASEATAARPEYRSGAALNGEAGARIGYGITDAIIFTGIVSVRFLDRGIRRSPIVGRPRPISTIFGISYML